MRLTAFILLAACAAGAGAPHAQEPAGAPAGAPTAVVTRALSEVAVYPQREASATVVSLNESRLAAEVSAAVAAIPAEAGQVVPAGSVLVRLDARDFELALGRAERSREAARARLALAEQQLDRGRKLEAQGFVSGEALAQRETELAVARADAALADNQVEVARRNLDKCVVRSPFRAVVKARLAQLGELAGPGTPLVALVDLDQVEVAALVQPRDVASLSGAKRIDFASAGGVVPVRLKRVSPAINREARNQEARLAFAGRAAAPGTEGRILWRAATPHVPADLLVRREAGLGVFTVEGGVARFVALPDAEEGRAAAVALSPSTRIVTQGRHPLRDGQRVGGG